MKIKAKKLEAPKVKVTFSFNKKELNLLRQLVLTCPLEPADTKVGIISKQPGRVNEISELTEEDIAFIVNNYRSPKPEAINLLATVLEKLFRALGKVEDE